MEITQSSNSKLYFKITTPRLEIYLELPLLFDISYVWILGKWQHWRIQLRVSDHALRDWWTPFDVYWENMALKNNSVLTIVAITLCMLLPQSLCKEFSEEFKVVPNKAGKIEVALDTPPIESSTCRFEWDSSGATVEVRSLDLSIISSIRLKPITTFSNSDAKR